MLPLHHLAKGGEGDLNPQPRLPLLKFQLRPNLVSVCRNLINLALPLSYLPAISREVSDQAFLSPEDNA